MTNLRLRNYLAIISVVKETLPELVEGRVSSTLNGALFRRSRFDKLSVRSA